MRLFLLMKIVQEGSLTPPFQLSILHPSAKHFEKPTQENLSKVLKSLNLGIMEILGKFQTTLLPNVLDFCRYQKVGAPKSVPDDEEELLG
ncbi:UNVERIFIED_CONTAM: hypothetical protein K2H54_022615 [Gekko kuhli]